MTATSDDNQPTAAVGDVDDTAVVAEGPRTVAAEQFSEPPTTIVPDVEPTRAAELAWSSEAETEELADRSREWRGRLLWLPLVALLCASVAVVVWFSVTLYRQGGQAIALPTASVPVAAPPVHVAPPSPPAAPGPRLDGAYQLAFDIDAATYSGKASPPKRSGAKTIWWAFRSSRTPAGCTASAVKLDDTDHTVSSAKNITDTFTFADGQWGDAPISSPDTVAPGCTNDSSQWVLKPQPDGTLAGTETVTLEGSCG